MHSSGKAQAHRWHVPHQPSSSSESGVRPCVVPSNETGAIGDVAGPHDEAPRDRIPSSESGIRPRSALAEEIGAIGDAIGPHEAALRWLMTQPARCADDAARFVMTIEPVTAERGPRGRALRRFLHTQGLVLRCPCCRRVASWSPADDDDSDRSR